MSRNGKWSLTFAWVATGLAVLGAIRWYQVSRPEHRLRLGQRALLRDDYDSADMLVERLEAAGHVDHARLLRGLSYLRRGLLNKAIVEYNAIDRDRTDLLNEASVHYGLGLYLHGRLAEAEPFLRHAVQIFPENVDVRRGLGALHYDRGGMREAIHHLEKWVELDDSDGRPYRFLAQIYDELDAPPVAASHYRKAIERNLPDDVLQVAHYRLAEVLIKLTEFREALDSLDRCDSGAQPSPALVECRAECLCGLRRHEEAAQLLEPLLQQTPSPRALRLKALTETVQGKDKEAIPYLERAVKLDVHDCQSRYQLAIALGRQGRRAEADEQLHLLELSQQLFKEMSDLNQRAITRSNDVAVRRQLAEVCTKLNKHELARMWLKAADSISTHQPGK